MKRTLDGAFLTSVANHPQVRPWIGGEGPADLSGVISDPANVALVWDEGGFVFLQKVPGCYEAHTLFLPEGRGGTALRAARDALRYLFIETDCVEVVTKVAHANRATALFTHRLGFDPIFDRADHTHFALTFDRWRARDPVIAGEGHAFHEHLEAAKVAIGSALEVHDDDDAHDRAVGASMLMAKRGQPQKGVYLYNKWAALAGYASVHLISASPPIVDVVDAVVAFREGRMEVLQCRS